jgi:hypothetical protein
MILAQLDLTTTNVNTQVYQIASGKNATVTIRFTNRSGGDVKIRLAVSHVNSVAVNNYIVFDHTLYPGDIYTETAMVLAGNDYIFAATDTLGVNVSVIGFEE